MQETRYNYLRKRASLVFECFASWTSSSGGTRDSVCRNPRMMWNRFLPDNTHLKMLTKVLVWTRSFSSLSKFAKMDPLLNGKLTICIPLPLFSMFIRIELGRVYGLKIAMKIKKYGKSVISVYAAIKANMRAKTFSMMLMKT